MMNMTLLTISNLLYKFNNSLNEKHIIQYIPPKDGDVWYVDSSGTDPTDRPNYDSTYIVDRTEKEIRLFRIYEIKASGTTVTDPSHSFSNKQLTDYERGYLTAYFEGMYQSGLID